MKKVKFKTTEEVETTLIFTDPIHVTEGDILIPKSVIIPDNTYIVTLITTDKHTEPGQ